MTASNPSCKDNANGMIKDGHCYCPCHKETPAAISKHQPEKEWWEEFDKLFPSFSELEISAIGATAPFFAIEEKAEVHTKQLAMREHNNKLRYIKSFIAKEIASAETRIAAQSEKKGRGDAVDFIMRESMIEPDFSPHADYIIPFKVLEAARSSEEGKTNNK